MDVKGNSKIKFIDNIFFFNNRVFIYKVVVYDYYLNLIEEFEVGIVKLLDEGKINKLVWLFIINIVFDGDVRIENDLYGLL